MPIKRNLIKRYAKFTFSLRSSRQKKGKRNWKTWFSFFVLAHFNKEFWNLNEIELSQLYMFLKNKFLTTHCCPNHNIGRDEKERARNRDLQKIARLIPSLRGKKCVKCGATKNLTRDHIIPYAEGGRAELSNLQILCEDCHNEKTLKDIKIWAVNNSPLPTPN